MTEEGESRLLEQLQAFHQTLQQIARELALIQQTLAARRDWTAAPEARELLWRRRERSS